MTVESSNRASGAAMAFGLAVVLFVIIGLAAKFCIKVPAVDAVHGSDIAKALADLRASEDKSLNSLGWVDQQRGIVRLPIDMAIRQAAKEDAAQIRADLKTRAENAAAPLPVAPAKPSIFE